MNKKPQKPHIYILINGVANSTISGGFKNCIELIKNFKKDRYQVTAIISNLGKIALTKEGTDNINFILTDGLEKDITNPLKIVWIYIQRAFICKKIIKQIQKENPDEKKVFILGSELYCNTYSLSEMKKSDTKIIIYNMVATNPFFGFSQKLHIPQLNEIHYWLASYLSFVALRIFDPKRSVKVVAVAENIKQDLLQWQFVNKYDIKVCYIGVNYDYLPSLALATQKEFDFVWIGRDHQQKGIDDLEKIIIKLVKLNPLVKIGIIGDAVDRMNKFINEYRLDTNVFCFGQVFGEKKYELLAKSKVFLFTSHFESFGIVVIENMMIKNLVIGYQIPSSLANFADRMILIKNFDIDDFADKAHSLAQNFGNYDELLESNRQFAKGFSWDASYNNYLKLIKQSL